MRFIILLFSLTLFYSCKSTEKQRRRANSYFDRHPVEMAIRCASQFQIRDSVGESVVDTITVGNMDYRTKLDSLSKMSENIAIQLLDSKRQADSISNECADVVISYMHDIDRLNREIKNISKTYSPCRPDTVRIVKYIYRQSLAREAILQDSIEQYKYQLSIVTDLSNTQQARINNSEDKLSEEKAERNQWMWKAIGTWIGMALVLGGALYMYIKK